MIPADRTGGDRRATIGDVAADAGVSIATVSRVVNQSGKVAPATRRAVLDAIARHRFVARPRRRSQPPGRLHDLVAVRCPYVLTDYFGIIVSAVARSLREHGKRVLLSAEAEDGREPSLAELLMAETTDGAILILPSEPGESLVDLRAQGYPFVVIDPRTPLPANIAGVSAAHLAGSRAATQHLVELGHRRIATIAGPSKWLAADGRLTGYRAVLAGSGSLPPDEFVRLGGEPTIANGYAAAAVLLDLPDPPTAIVAFNDKMAVGAVHAARERGLHVPADLSVVGFDDLDLSRTVTPPLTTVRQPMEELARVGVELLMRLVEGRAIDALHLELATELVIRDSTAPPRS